MDKKDDILSTTYDQTLSPKIVKPGRSGRGEQRRSAFMSAPVTVRSAFHGNVGERGGGTERGGGWGLGGHQPSLISAEPVGASCECVSSWCDWFYSHSVVPGGLEVRSYMTREMPGIFLISFTIFSTTCEHRRQVTTKHRGQIATSKNTETELRDWVRKYLLGDVVSWHGGDAGHEIAGDEGANHHRAPAGWLLLQRVAVKVQGGQDDGHLADLTGVA